MPSTIARCVLPVPGGPKAKTHSVECGKSSWPRCSITVFVTERWKEKSSSSRVLRAGRHAERMRGSPPWASRAETEQAATWPRGYLVAPPRKAPGGGTAGVQWPPSSSAAGRVSECRCRSHPGVSQGLDRLRKSSSPREPDSVGGEPLLGPCRRFTEEAARAARAEPNASLRRRGASFRWRASLLLALRQGRASLLLPACVDLRLAFR